MDISGLGILGLGSGLSRGVSLRLRSVTGYGDEELRYPVCHGVNLVVRFRYYTRGGGVYVLLGGFRLSLEDYDGCLVDGGVVEGFPWDEFMCSLAARGVEVRVVGDSFLRRLYYRFLGYFVFVRS
jgi:hypothetical protein|nr:MAG TPA: hypothetical protein [Caudoviricetes sp.]